MGKLDTAEPAGLDREPSVNRKPLNHVLAKPAGPDCSMACGYCFYRRKEALFPAGGPHFMSEPVLEEMIRQLMRVSASDVSIGWQGGEPTLRGLQFFRKAVEHEKRYGAGKTVGNGLQTNGLLIDREWADFLKEHNFLTGLSIDGPEHVHDHYRRMSGGDGTWKQVRDRARLLLDAGVSVNALSVVNDYSVRFPEEIYESHKRMGLAYMQFVPCVERDLSDPGQAASFSVSGADFGRFLCTMFDLWRADFHEGVPATSIRFFESLLFSYAGFPPAECTLDAECGRYLVVEHNGDAYACDFFVEPAWRLGNIMDESMEEMLNSSLQMRFGERKARLPDPCLECGWMQICRGGCVKDRTGAGNHDQLNHLCEAYRIFFEHADADFRQLVDEWRRKQAAKERTFNSGTGPIGRNDTCPCGSGRKYKKCCGKD